MEKPSNNFPNNNNFSAVGANILNNNSYQNNVPAPIGGHQTIPYAQPNYSSNQNYNQNYPNYQGQQAYIQPNQQAQPFQNFQPVQNYQPIQNSQVVQQVQPPYTQIPQTIREQQQVVVLVNQVNPGLINNPPRYSFRTVCPSCNKVVDTHIEYENNWVVWLACFLLFFFTLFFCCIPFCISSIKDVVHRCPMCNRVIAYKKQYS